MDDGTDMDKAEFKNMLISPVYVHKVCRSCLGEVHKDYFWLGGYYLEKKLIDIYKNVTSIEVDSNDSLPKKLCISCYDYIIKFDLFKNKVLESEKFLADLAFSLCTELFEDKEETKAENVTKTENNLYYDIQHTQHQETDSEDEISLSERLQKVTKPDQKCDIEDESGQIVIELKKVKEIESHSDDVVDILQMPKAKVRKRGSKRKLREKVVEGCLENNQKRERRKESCKECGKFVFAYKMPNHLRTHTKEKPFACETCGASFSEKSNLTRHAKIHGEHRPYTCTVCGKGFLRPSSKAIHEITAHVSEKNILCLICGKAFKHQYFLKKHMMNIHDKSEMKVKTMVKVEGSGYPCPICGHFFRTKSSLTVHRMKHEQPRAFLCNICGNAFSTKAVLENHQKVHSGEKNFSCNTCNKKFRFISTLKTHILVHSGEKPLTCPICNKQFRQHSHLNTHMRGQHSTKRPYQCNFCTKSFKQNSNLTVHTRIHTGETPYHCDVCQKGFYDSSSMKKHKRSHFDRNNVTTDKWDKMEFDISKIDENNTLQT